jgi:hypothetical protein
MSATIWRRWHRNSHYPDSNPQRRHRRVDCGEFLEMFVTDNETNTERYHSLDSHSEDRV